MSAGSLSKQTKTKKDSMKEKKQVEEKDRKPTGEEDSIFDAAPQPVNKNVTVSSGPYIEELPVAGMAVGEIRKKFADRFDIDEKAQAIIDGNDANEDYLTKCGESLMFVRHAGEKGAQNIKVEIDGKDVSATGPEGQKRSMDLSALVDRICPTMSTGPCILPTGLKAVLSRGTITIWVWEKAPAIQKLSWIRGDSPTPYGPGTKYRDVRIALPYLVIFAVFGRDYSNGMPFIIRTDECFFRNEPLKQLGDLLYYPALLNCSKYNQQDSLNPLSWICTQHLKQTKKMTSGNAGDRFNAGFEAVRYCLLETSFNLSSEHHEGNSWYGASKTIDKRIATIEAWENATAEDPLFVLDMPWIPTNHSVTEVAERIFKRTEAADNSVKTSNDLARVIFAQ